MADMGKLRVPVYLRVGVGGTEYHVGDVVCAPAADVSTRVPGLLRKVAAEMERPVCCADTVEEEFPADADPLVHFFTWAAEKGYTSGLHAEAFVAGWRAARESPRRRLDT